MKRRSKEEDGQTKVVDKWGWGYGRGDRRIELKRKEEEEERRYGQKEEGRGGEGGDRGNNTVPFQCEYHLYICVIA